MRRRSRRMAAALVVPICRRRRGDRPSYRRARHWRWRGGNEALVPRKAIHPDDPRLHRTRRQHELSSIAQPATAASRPASVIAGASARAIFPQHRTPLFLVSSKRTALGVRQRLLSPRSAPDIRSELGEVVERETSWTKWPPPWSMHTSAPSVPALYAALGDCQMLGPDPDQSAAAWRERKSPRPTIRNLTGMAETPLAASQLFGSPGLASRSNLDARMTSGDARRRFG